MEKLSFLMLFLERSVPCCLPFLLETCECLYATYHRGLIRTDFCPLLQHSPMHVFSVSPIVFSRPHSQECQYGIASFPLVEKKISTFFFCTLVHCHNILPADTNFIIMSHISDLKFLHEWKYPRPIIPEKEQDTVNPNNIGTRVSGRSLDEETLHCKRLIFSCLCSRFWHKVIYSVRNTRGMPVCPH